MDSLPTGEGSSPANFTVIHNIHWDWSQSIRQQANDLPVICWVFAITGHTHATPGTILWAYPPPERASRTTFVIRATDSGIPMD